MLWYSLALCWALPLAAAAQTQLADLVTTQQLALWAYVVDYVNTPVPSVNLRFEVAGTKSGAAKTGSDGSARIQGSNLGQIVRAEIDDADWYCPEGVAEGEIGGRPILFRVFHSKADVMSRDERLAAHRARIRAAIQERRVAAADGSAPTGEAAPAGATTVGDSSVLPATASGASAPGAGSGSSGAGSAAVPTPKGQPPSVYDDPIWGYKANRPVIAFLAGLRVEQLQGYPTGDDAPSTLTAEYTIPVIDSLGHPVSDVAVDLLELKADAGSKLNLFGVERTDARGKAVFRGLKPSSWYRAECQTDDAQIGRSTVFQPRPSESRELKPIVVRPEDRALGGFVLRSNGPAAYAKVRFLDSSGAAVLSTTADPRGYFVLGPLPPGSITLDISHYDPTQVNLTLPIPADRDTPEVLIPLDALARDRVPQPAQDNATP